MNRTKIPWASHSWNPVTGCSPVSEGCQNCYARAMARRFAPRPAQCVYGKIGQCTGCGDCEPVDYFKVTLHPDRLDELLRRKKSAKIFVCSMSDLFHEDVPDEFIEEVWRRMIRTPHLTYQILTKRPERMLSFVNSLKDRVYAGHHPLYNIWLGVTAENQARANERIPLLLQTPAAKRFVSIEPCLSGVGLLKYLPGGNCNESGRKRIYGADGYGCVQNRSTRSSLANGTLGRREQNRKSILPKNVSGTKASGNQRKNRLSSGDIYSGAKEACSCSPQNSLDDICSYENSERNGNKPQRWEQKKPSSSKLGGSDTSTKFLTCRKGFGCVREEKTVRLNERNGEVNGNPSCRNQRDVQEQINGSKPDSENVRSEASNSQRNSFEEKLDLVIIGGESGPGARECREEWVNSVYEQCQEAGVPFFFKQGGAKWMPDRTSIPGNGYDERRLKEIWEQRREWPR